MKLLRIIPIALIAACVGGGIYIARPQTIHPHPKEVHLRNIRQLTFGGTNAEAYFSFDGQKVIFQSTREPYKCDQIFTMNRDGSNVRLVSTAKGRTTCGYFMPDGKRIIYRSDRKHNDLLILDRRIAHRCQAELKVTFGRFIRRTTSFRPKPTEPT